MKICVTSRGENPDAPVDPKFGRAAYFIFVDTETGFFEAVRNPNAASGGGAGIQSGRLAAEKSVRVVITGNVGPNAFETLKAAGIDVITGASGKVREVVEAYKKKGYTPVEGPTTGPKSGMGGKS